MEYKKAERRRIDTFELYSYTQVLQEGDHSLARKRRRFAMQRLASGVERRLGTLLEDAADKL